LIATRSLEIAARSAACWALSADDVAAALVAAGVDGVAGTGTAATVAVGVVDTD
jgi:hypothetical protein